MGLSEYDLSKTLDWVRPTAVKLQLTAGWEQCWREAVIASVTRQDTTTLRFEGWQAILA